MEIEINLTVLTGKFWENKCILVNKTIKKAYSDFSSKLKKGKGTIDIGLLTIFRINLTANTFF